METLILKKKDFDIKKFSFYRKKIFKEKKILIFRKVFSKNLDKLLRAAKLQMNLKPRYIKTNFKNKDLYIFNKNIKKSKVRGYYKKVLFYPWNKKNIKFFKFLMNAFKIKNYIDKDKHFLKNNLYNNVKSLVIQIMNYPAKFGYLSKHSDSNTNTKCIMQICVQNKNNNKSGLVIYNNKKSFFIDNYLKKGDIIIFSSSLKHSVSKDKNENRWSLILSQLNYR